jgi:hypothetical protein
VSPESIGQTVAAILTPLVALVGVGSRKRRLRGDIRENLSLASEVEKDDILRDHTPVAGWLRGKVTVDVARLVGQNLGTPKKPIDKSALTVGAIFVLIFGGWTYLIVRDGFVWYSVFPGTLAFLSLISILGTVTNREIAPTELDDLPPGATPIASESATERVATAVALASTGLHDRLRDDAQVGVALRFVRAMRDGRYTEGLALTDNNWQLCRIQGWLWNNRETLDANTEKLDLLAASLTKEHLPADLWSQFVASETYLFTSVWSGIDPDELGVADRRRRIARDYDLVILTPLGKTEGYFVMSATMLPNVLTISVHRVETRWFVASHLGAAPPVPGWPPAWWVTGDQAVEELPED